MQAKFVCHTVTNRQNAQQVFEFSAVTDDSTPEDARYHKYTPSGSIVITVDNPNLKDHFEPGDKVYVTFQKAVDNV